MSNSTDFKNIDLNSQIKTIRLGKSLYNRPDNGTITDTLQDPDEYKKKLKGYVEVSNIDYVSIRTHVRYFIYDNDTEKWKFRTGGLLTKKHDKYVILSNGKYSWSVQRHVNMGDDLFETKFFKILTKQELTEIALEKQQKEIEQLKQENLHLRRQLHYV